MVETIRTFIAIELGDELKGLLMQVGQEIQSRIAPRTVRWVKPHAMHLTLVFLGDTPVTQLDTIQRAMTAAAAEVPPITFRAVGLGCFPNPRRPRVVWVGVDEPAGHLKQLKAALDRELEPLGYKAERRRFSPHLTLGRVHKRAGRGEAQGLGQVVESATLKELCRVTARQLCLIRSELRPAGAIYTTLASVPL